MLAALKGVGTPEARVSHERETRESIASQESHHRTHRELLDRLHEARDRSDALFELVVPDALYERPIPERHRIIFYVGHLEAFDWNLLNNPESGLNLGLKSVHPDFDRLFAFGIDPVGGGLPTDVPADWPSLGSVRDYVASIRGALDAKLSAISLEEPSLEESSATKTRHGFSLATLLNVAVEHRLMHVETLAYMLHQLPISMKVQQPIPLDPVVQRVEHKTVAVPSGVVELGLSRQAASFGWDNEYELHTQEVPAFEIDRYKITNRQYLEFLTNGGYRERALWAEDDWNWKEERGITHPLFWNKSGGRWLYRTMFAELPFDEVLVVLDWPVYVSHAEAAAYARWAGKSLPSEAEWQRAAYGATSCVTPGATTSVTTEKTSQPASRSYPWGNDKPSVRLGNFDLQRWDPAPVNAFPAGQSFFGVHDLLGNGWEWTSTVFEPFPNFEPFPFYQGYSADFFDGKHFVMKGGSARTAACMLRPSFRNWFQAHYQNVYAGFRCVSR